LWHPSKFPEDGQINTKLVDGGTTYGELVTVSPGRQKYLSWGFFTDIPRLLSLFG
jgi:hypothetical protein